MNPEDMAILDDFMKVRNIQPQTIYNYRQSIKNYTASQGLTLKQLLEEAEREEEERIRLKNRTLKKRLITHRNYLINEKGCSSSTIQKQMGQLKTIYHHYEIEIPKLPKFNDRNVKQIEEIYYDDLPTKDIIKEAIRVSNPLMTAIILFICSSGCARKEVTNLKISDFITATQEYHNCTDIQDVISELKKQTDIVPIFKLKRAKTNKYYYTFCSPEAVTAILSYLETRTDKMTSDSQLFKVHIAYLTRKFTELNETVGGYKKGVYGLIRPHMFRKFHASNLARGENGLTVEEIDSLQGRSKNKTHNSYFLDDPQELKKKYISNIDKVLINYDKRELTFESPEVLELKKKAAELEKENAEIKQNINKAVDDRISEVFNEYGIEEILRKHGL